MAMAPVPSTSSSATTAKRTRDQDPWGETPEAKRLREDLLFDILDNDDDDGEAAGTDPAVADLADVMRSFEEEIAASVSPASASSSSLYDDDYGTDASDVQQRAQQLGFLLEASDDELGLPPASGEEELQQQQPLPATPSGLALEEATAGNYWGFQDQDGFLAAIPFGGEEEGWQGSAAALDAAFGDDYGDAYLSWSSDLADFSLVA